MRSFLAVLIGSMSFAAIADCRHELPVRGVESLSACDPKTQACLPADKAFFEFMDKAQDDQAVLFVSLHASPWHAYDAESRILTPDHLAGTIREFLARHQTVKRVELRASWSGVRPAANTLSIAERLSKALGGFPVTGTQGFLWVSADGGLRTTRQAVTLSVGQYLVARDGEVMVSAVAAWPLSVIDAIRKKQDARALLRAGAAWDIFGLCPDNALATFEEAAGMGNAVGAYNAALMRLERGTKPDIEKATALLLQAAKAGDAPSRAQLAKLQLQAR